MMTILSNTKKSLKNSKKERNKFGGLKYYPYLCSVIKKQILWEILLLIRK